jgi:hypothetical protein
LEFSVSGIVAEYIDEKIAQNVAHTFVKLNPML